jgi:hypothetical protein
VFRDLQCDSYDKLVTAQFTNASGDLQALVGLGDRWRI